MIERIEKSKKLEYAIPIIPEEDCVLGIIALKAEFCERFGDNLDQVLVVPILNGGKRIGEKVSDGLDVDISTMQMSYYDEFNKKLETPICVAKPDINKIIAGGKVKKLVFAEGVVESEGTIKKSIEVINKMIAKYNQENGTNYENPEYHVFALVSKVNGQSTIPNFAYSFNIDSRIWVHGWGVDNNQYGRDMNSIFGVLSAQAETFPEPPYFTKSKFYYKYI